MFTFTLVWLGQVISLIGSGLTGFALGVWVYQTTGSVTQLSLIYLCTELPLILVAPLAGIVADRCDRRWVLIWSDAGAGLCTGAIALLLLNHALQPWHLYLSIIVSSICKGFQEPAYFSAMTLLVPKQHLGRASGMNQVGQAARHLLAPILASLLVSAIQIQGVLFVDILTFGISLITLGFVQFPELAATHSTSQSFWQNLLYGWNYIAERPGLLMMTAFFALTNFAIGLAQVLITPLILSFADVKTLGIVLSLGGSGWLVGSLVMIVWGGSKRLIPTILGFEFLLGFATILAGLRPSAIFVTIAVFLFFFSAPIVVSANHTIWQKKVAPEIQGRVFAIRGMLAWASFPIAYLSAGALSDRIFEPLLQPNGVLASSIGHLLGVGNGRGIGLLFVMSGTLIMLVTISAYFYPRLRWVENELPDQISTPSN